MTRVRLERPSQGFWGTGETGHLFQGNRGTKPNFEGNRGTKTILGNRAHKKTNFRFLRNRGTSQFISGEQGNRYPPPPPPGRASLDLDPFNMFKDLKKMFNGFSMNQCGKFFGGADKGGRGGGLFGTHIRRPTICPPICPPMS